MSRGVKTEVAEREGIVESLRAGRTSVEIAEDFGLSIGTIRRVRKEAGLVAKARNRKCRPERARTLIARRLAMLAPKLAAIQALDSWAERRGAQLRLAEELRREA